MEIRFDFAFCVKFALVALAVFRVAQMLVFDDGPADLFLRLRVWTGRYDRDEDGNPYAGVGRLRSGFGAMLECPYCVGVWLAFAGMCVLLFVDGMGLGVLVWAFVLVLALAGAQGALEAVAGRDT